MLPFLSVVGWLPAIIGCMMIARWGEPPRVVSAAPSAGLLTSITLTMSLTILAAVYVWARSHPPSTVELLLTVGFSVAGALTLPVLFSADVYAYAYYGDLTLHGRNPYLTGPPPTDALSRTAVVMWGHQVPPRCVYGPIAVGVATLADVAGQAAGPTAQIMLGRLAASAAYAMYAWAVLRLSRRPATRAALLLHPTVIWSVGEGHNDAVTIALVVTGLALGRARPLFLTLAVLVKAPALLCWRSLIGVRERPVVLAGVTAGYMPAIWSLLHGRTFNSAPFDPATWQSPIGLVAALFGPGFAVLSFGCAFSLAIVVARKMPPVERTCALALVAWFMLPNAYPWYSLWIVPIAARDAASRWSRALVVAAFFAPARSIIDAIYPAADRIAIHGVFHLPMIGLQYVPPLLVLALASRPLRAPVCVAVACVAFTLLGSTANAQSASPTPSTITQTPQPATPLPAASPLLTTAPTATALPSAVPTAIATIIPAATPNPFGYIITPQLVPTTSPDGPHILQVELNDKHIRAGGPLIVQVLTSANVVGVEARTLGRFIPIPQNRPGIFAAVYTMPDGIPFWLLNRSYDVVIAAATADGRQTSVTVPLLLTR